MRAQELRGKSQAEMSALLVEKLKEAFKLRMQRGSGQPLRPGQLQEIRRDIARIKTVMSEVRRSGQQA